MRITPQETREETTIEPTIIVEENTTTQENRTIPEPEEQCMGCERDGECHSQGTIINDRYCDGLEFQTLKAQGGTCSQNYECEEGSCSNGTCGEERKNIIVRVLSWFASIF